MRRCLHVLEYIMGASALMCAAIWGLFLWRKGWGSSVEYLGIGALVFIGFLLLAWANVSGIEVTSTHAKESQRVNEKGTSRDYEFSIGYVDIMDGVSFEYFVASKLNKLGWNASVTKASGDYGIDIIAYKGNEKWGLQCKRSNDNIGVKAIQEACSGAKFYNCDRAVVVTNRYYTRSARMMAKRTNVILWNRDWVSMAISQAKLKQDA